MNDQTAEAVATEAPAKTVIRPDLNRYVRDKSGNGKRTHRTDDFVARTLAGKSVEDVLKGAPLLGIDAAKWSHLNVGQQRMLVGNALRHRLQDTKNPLKEQDVTDVYGEPVAPYDADAAKVKATATDTGNAGEGEQEAATEGDGEPEPAPKARKTVSKAKK